jgi:hypothetical protein
MKKTIYAVISAALLAASFATPAQADTKSLVIIDSYFDLSKLPSSVTQVCVASDKCLNKAAISNSVSDPSNHGTAMAEIALKQNPALSLTVIRASDVSAKGSVSGVSGNTLLLALKWVEANKATVGAVSFSYSLSGNMTKIGDCKLSNFGLTNIAVVDPQIRTSIANLKSTGIPFFAATGNNGASKPVSYPACITETVSVGSGVGGAYIPSSSRDINTDVIGSLPANVFSYKSNIFGLVPQTTSSANVAVATKYLSEKLDKGIVFVIP